MNGLSTQGGAYGVILQVQRGCEFSSKIQGIDLSALLQSDHPRAHG